MKKCVLLFAAIVAGYVSPALAVQKDAIDRAQALFTEQLELNCTPGAEPDWIAEDAVFKYALTNLNVWLRVEGRDAIAKHLCAISEFGPSAQVQNVRYFPTLHDDVVFVQYDLMSADGTRESVSPLAIIEMRGSQIINFTQLSRSPQSLKVLQSATEGMN